MSRDGFLRRGDKIALFIGRGTSPLSKEQLTIFVIFGTKSEKHNSSKLEGIGSKEHDFLATLVINLLSLTAVGRLELVKLTLNRGIIKTGKSERDIRQCQRV